MNRKNAIYAAVSLIAIIGAGVYAFRTTGKTTHLPTKASVNCVCLACRQLVHVETRVAIPPPYECPECGQTAVYPVFHCQKCNTYFVPPLTADPNDDAPRLPVVPVCPKCGNSNLGTFTGELDVSPDQLVLPAWPPK